VPYRNCPEEIIGEKAQPQSYTINDGLLMSANITVTVQEGLKLNVIQKKQWKHCLGIPVFTATMTTPPLNIGFLNLVKKYWNLDFQESRLEFQEMKTKRLFMI